MKIQLENYKKYLEGIKKSLVYYNYLRPFVAYLSEREIDFSLITKDQIANYLTEKNYKTKSINTLLQAIKSFVGYLEIKEHSIYQMKLLQVEKRQPKYISYEELQDAIKYYATYNNRGMSSLKCNALLKFLFFTGLRKGELLALKREEIDLTNCIIKV